jgi:hypothetical protein
MQKEVNSLSEQVLGLNQHNINQKSEFMNQQNHSSNHESFISGPFKVGLGIGIASFFYLMYTICKPRKRFLGIF